MDYTACVWLRPKNMPVEEDTEEEEKNAKKTKASTRWQNQKLQVKKKEKKNDWV